MYSIKEASKLLDCSTQNIYRQKTELISKGLMEQAETGSYYLNEKGINYLREKRIETMKANNQDFNQVDNQVFKSVANPIFADNNEIIVLLKEQLQEAKNEKEYWKKQTELKDQELKDKNLYIQELNTKAFALLGTAEQNKKQEEENKKSFWKKIFG
jgi:predicted transcriptional regulator